MTFFNKRVFPAIWFGGLALTTAGGLAGGALQGIQWPAVLVPVGLAVFGYWLMRTLVFDLMDEVLLDDNILVVRNRGEEDRMPVTNIINVDSTIMVNPERITLSLREPSIFGDEISFTPPARLWPFSPSPIAKELIRLSRGDDAG